MTKKVSVIIPTFKRPKFLPRAIESVINTDWPNLEIIVVDDNNNGDSFRLETENLMGIYLEKYSNIKYIKHVENKNGSAARNTGFYASSGDYIMFLDDDDEFYPCKIEEQVKFMDSHSEEWGACYTKYYDLRKGKIVSKGTESKQGDLLIEELARNLFIHAGSNLMIRRKVIDELQGFDETFLRNQDVEFLVRLLRKYKLGFVNVVGLAVNVHSRNYKISYYELTDQYIKKFYTDIMNLDLKDRNVVFKMIGLQLIRNAVENKDFKQIDYFKKRYKVNYSDIVKYFSHLIFRFITRKSYGFPMKKLYGK